MLRDLAGQFEQATPSEAASEAAEGAPELAADLLEQLANMSDSKKPDDKNMESFPSADMLLDSFGKPVRENTVKEDRAADRPSKVGGKQGSVEEISPDKSKDNKKDVQPDKKDFDGKSDAVDKDRPDNKAGVKGVMKDAVKDTTGDKKGALADKDGKSEAVGKDRPDNSAGVKGVMKDAVKDNVGDKKGASADKDAKSEAVGKDRPDNSAGVKGVMKDAVKENVGDKKGSADNDGKSEAVGKDRPDSAGGAEVGTTLATGVRARKEPVEAHARAEMTDRTQQADGGTIELEARECARALAGQTSEGVRLSSEVVSLLTRSVQHAYQLNGETGLTQLQMYMQAALRDGNGPSVELSHSGRGAMLTVNGSKIFISLRK